MAQSKKPAAKKLPLYNAVYVFKTKRGNTEFVDAGTVWGSEKGCVVNINAEPVGDTGDWDGKTIMLFPVRGNDKACAEFRAHALETDDGKKLPLFIAKAVFTTEDRRTHYVDCGRCFLGNDKNLVLTLDAKPYGAEHGDWRPGVFNGFFTEAKAEAPKAATV